MECDIPEDRWRARLAAIASDQEYLLCGTIRLLTEQVDDSTGQTDPVIESRRDVYDFLQMWIGFHARSTRNIPRIPGNDQ